MSGEWVSEWVRESVSVSEWVAQGDGRKVCLYIGWRYVYSCIYAQSDKMHTPQSASRWSGVGLLWLKGTNYTLHISLLYAAYFSNTLAKFLFSARISLYIHGFLSSIRYTYLAKCLFSVRIFFYGGRFLSYAAHFLSYIDYAGGFLSYSQISSTQKRNMSDRRRGTRQHRRFVLFGHSRCDLR